MNRALLFILVSCWLPGCSPLSKSSLNKRFEATEEKFKDHTGFVLYDLAKKKTIFEYNSQKYFTPASNTKIFTLYASLKLLGDSVPALHYVETPDSMIIWGTGDPSFLYKNVFQNNRTYDFLSAVKQPLYLSTSNFYTSNLGPGWSWDDYNSYYSAERSPFPVYGDIFSVKLAGDSLHVYPEYFARHYRKGPSRPRRRVERELYSNDFVFSPDDTLASGRKEWDLPMKIDQQLIVEMLADTINKFVTPISKALPANTKTLYSVPVDSLYRVLMQDSDNFIAEQLLLMCADVLSDSLMGEIAIDYMKENFLGDLPDEPEWVDGSGLSRYNLFTPRSVAQMWIKIAEIIPTERLYPLLATGGLKGTIRNWYKADKPFIFGKTGSLSNNHCLSGFLVTRSGKTLVFSFMNNNFVVSGNAIRREMQDILKIIYERY